MPAMNKYQSKQKLCYRNISNLDQQRGVTLIELMITMSMMILVVGGSLYFLAVQTQTHRTSYLRSQNIIGGQTALSLMQKEIGNAGLGLPSYLAIAAYDQTYVPTNWSNDTATQCKINSVDVDFPLLAVAWIDMKRQWEASGVSSGAITLDSASPKPIGVATDIALNHYDWLFLFRHFTTGPAGGGLHGYGLMQLNGDRAAAITNISVDATASFSTYQGVLNMGASSPINTPPSSGRLIQVMKANVTSFYVACSDTMAYPVFYWEPYQDGADRRVPIALNVTSMSFSFQLDGMPSSPAPDGVPDDCNENGSYDALGDLCHTFDDPPATDDCKGCDDGGIYDDPSVVYAVNVEFTIESTEPDPRTGRIHSQTFQELIQTVNIHTRSRDKYVFIDNGAL